MTAKKVSVKSVAQRAKREDKALRKGDASFERLTNDSFTNFAHGLGVGADSPLSSATYGFNPITRVRTVLEWIHRGSWLGGVAIDVVADDMTKAGVELHGKIKPEDIEGIEEDAVSYGVWNALNENIKWSRLYGGSIAVMLVDGQDFKTPLRLETVSKGQFQGLLVLDRWMVEPSLQDLVDAPGPDLGLPKFYTVLGDAPALRSVKIHYTRCIRLEGIKLPYWQRVQENLWGISVLERLYDRMVAFDSASTGAAQLVYKSYIRTYKIKGMREIISNGGPALEGLMKFVDMMRRMQGIEGMTLIDGEDEFEGHTTSAFSGLDAALSQFALQLSGALQIPMVRLFGQSPAGFNSGDSELRMYYDSILQQQEKNLKVGVTKVYRLLAQSRGTKLPDGFYLKFRNLWQLDEVQKADVGSKVTESVARAEESGLVSPKVAMQELRQAGRITGIFTNITDKDINDASDEAAPAAEEAMLNAPQPEEGEGNEPSKPGKAKPAKPTAAKPGKSKDEAADAIPGAPAPEHNVHVNITTGAPVINNQQPAITLPDIHVAPAAVTVQPAAINVAAPIVKSGDTIVHVPRQEQPIVNVGGPTVNVPKGDTYVNVPETKPANVRVEVGDTHVTAHIAQPAQEPTKKTITSKRDPVSGDVTTTIKQDGREPVIEVHKTRKDADGALKTIVDKKK